MVSNQLPWIQGFDMRQIMIVQVEFRRDLKLFFTFYTILMNKMKTKSHCEQAIIHRMRKFENKKKNE